MRACPGGQIDPEDIVGRDSLVERLWQVLERQSLVLTAERRMGKTCVMARMRSRPTQDALMVYRDLEGVRTPLEFVEVVFHDVEEYLSRLKRTAVKAREWLAHLAGTEIGSVVRFPTVAAAHWKVLLTKTLEDLAENQDRLVVLFWDEVPLMLKNIADRDEEGTALEILDVLRGLRHTHAGLRMVFTGSIGLHHVITALKEGGSPDDPTNDMYTVDVPPLDRDDAIDLADQLLEGEGIAAEGASDVAATIADAVDCIPFYIHHVVDQMKARGTLLDPAAVGDLVTQCLTDPQDPWHLQHYRDRIQAYYRPEDRPSMLALLDALAEAQDPLAFTDVFDRLKARVTTDDEERARGLLGLLMRDHYVIQDSDARYLFRFPLIKRWWTISRGLMQ